VTSVLRLVGQLVIYGATALLIGVLSNGPTYEHMPPDMALIKVSFAHSAKKAGECRRLTAEELAEVAANMRTAEVCPRGRLPILLELRVDGDVVYRNELPPTGLSGDGPARIYARIPVTPGVHELFAGLVDSDRQDGFDYTLERTIDLAPEDNLAVGFRPEMGGFTLEGGN